MDASAPSSLPTELFDRIDETPDARFYVQPRLVAHIDPETIAALADYYREVLPADADVLDLMSSWVSHLPEDVAYSRVAVLGMNAPELAAKALVMALAEQIEGVRAVDGGPLRFSRFVEGLTVLLIGINGRYKARSHARIAGLP